MNEYIRGFLQAYLTWAKNDAPDGMYGMDSSSGLCYNFGNYLRKATDLHVYERQGLRNQLTTMLERVNGCPDYPFGEEEYEEEAMSCTHHLNPVRIQWINDVLAE